jgi:hypothetical protein
MTTQTIGKVGIMVELMSHVHASSKEIAETLGHYLVEIEFNKDSESYDANGVRRTVESMGGISQELRELADLLDQVQLFDPHRTT